EGAPTSMIVRTDTRAGAFELEPGEGVTAMSGRFVYPEDHRIGGTPPSASFAPQGQFAPQAQFQGGQFPTFAPPGGMAQAVERYRLKGDKASRPDWIADDGQRMFSRWSEDKPMPAVFAVDDTGREMTVDGFMRNGAYTIDRVWPQLVFRIDRHMASATRSPPAKVGKDKVRKDPPDRGPAMASDPSDPRPQVPVRTGSSGIWIFGAVASLGGGTSFLTLDANRRASTAPATRPTVPAYEEAQPSPAYASAPQPQGQQVSAVPQPLAVAPAAPPRASSGAAPSSWAQGGAAGSAAGYPPRSDTGPAVVYDAASSPAAAAVAAATASTTGASTTGEGASPTAGPERVKAGRRVNPASTVTQGSVIQCVLETALDTTRAGLARAIVSRDVRGFDGSQVLVPRGSRSIGEYQSDVAGGQNRASIRWTRSIRPDGVTIAIQSPSADTLGRAGVKGKVNSHFLERYAGAILQ
ncbi:hypothetical protein OY671_007623, partial [Metschnikowia pulcherrima]